MQGSFASLSMVHAHITHLIGSPKDTWRSTLQRGQYVFPITIITYTPGQLHLPPPPYRSCILFDFGNIWHGTVFRYDRLESAVVFTRATLICSETLKFLSKKLIYFCPPRKIYFFSVFSSMVKRYRASSLPNQRISPERRTFIISRYKELKTLRAVANELKISRNGVRYWVRQEYYWVLIRSTCR